MTGLFVRFENKVTGKTKTKYISSFKELRNMEGQAWEVIDPSRDVVVARLKKDLEEIKRERIHKQHEEGSSPHPSPSEITITSDEEAQRIYKELKAKGYNFGVLYINRPKNEDDRKFNALKKYWAKKEIEQTKKAYEEFKNEPGYEDVYKKQMEHLKILYGHILDLDSERESAKKIVKLEDTDSEVKQDPGDSTPDALKKGKKIVDDIKEELTDIFEETDKKDKMILGFGIVLLAAGILLMKR